MNLWTQNAPNQFWLCQPDLPAEIWETAIWKSSAVLGLQNSPQDTGALLAATLGEGRFGGRAWRLSPPRQVYYGLKPFLPLKLRLMMKATYFKSVPISSNFSWPVDNRYAHFLFEVLRQALLLAGQESIFYRSLWPDGRQFGLTLTHDIETVDGQAFVRKIADLEERMGFRSSFNFVPERYPLDRGLMRDLRARGFEVGVHGLKHDGKLYSSHQEFKRRAKMINRYLEEFGAVGFRSPLMHRNPYWLQELNAEYDLSFFDTDPYEPMPGGVMSVWPFMMGKLVEMPYTLVQDSTLDFILKDESAQRWLQKLEFIRNVHGMALMNTHPDYMARGAGLLRYTEILQALGELRDEFWHGLPCEMARWWRRRADMSIDPHEICMKEARLNENGISLEGATFFFVQEPEYVERGNNLQGSDL